MPKAIVLGGYGLIGFACMRALSSAGFDVTGIGRSKRSALAADPKADWIIRDIPTISTEDWQALLADADVVVNASGALQDGAKDDLVAIHVTAVQRLVAAAANVPVRIIQISAAGVTETASTAFFRTKEQGDEVISSQLTNWVILRPTLVLSPEAYGGTALLRGVAALPLIQPRVLPDAQIQTVYVGDVADAVLSAAQGMVPEGTVADLTEPEAQTFPELVAKVRRWQGWSDPVLRVPVPGFAISALGMAADLLGHLGWRSPLRTTALRVLSEGVRGDPGTWENSGGRPCRRLDQTLAAIPATRQERVFARAYFALPMAIGTLSVFWLLSGLITMIDPARAMALLTARGAATWIATVTVLGGAVADILLGLSILWRSWTKRAALGMILLSCGYLIGSIIAAPDLWADPLGPMVKVFPGMALAAVVWLLIEER